MKISTFAAWSLAFVVAAAASAAADTLHLRSGAVVSGDVLTVAASRASCRAAGRRPDGQGMTPRAPNQWAGT
jgi:hypothetical protein